MKKRIYRLLCGLLAAVMLVPGTWAKGTGRAEADVAAEDGTEATAELQAAATSGTCGANLTWTLDGGTLTISGTGDMTDFQSYNGAPWYSSRASITSVNIGSGVNTIGKNAFYRCEKITSVFISPGVTQIKLSAFYYCSALRTITIPASVIDVRGYAFAQCKLLTDVWYGGTEAQWNSITFGLGNKELTSSAIHFDNQTSCKITFAPNGGTVTPASKTVNSGEAIGELPVPVRDEYTFQGWTASDGTSVTAKTVITADTTLTAKWKEIPKAEYTVTFDPSGGTVTTPSRTITEGDAIGELPVSTRDGYTFQGWFASDGKAVTAATVIKSNMTITARWNKNPDPDPVSSFDVTRDAWSFGNSMKDFGYTGRGPGATYPIRDISFFLMLGKTVKAKSLFRRTILNPWNGNCAGMSGTTALFYDGSSVKPSDFGQSSVYALTKNSASGSLSALTFIEAMQVAQYTDAFARARSETLVDAGKLKEGKTLNALYEAVSGGAAKQQATLIAVVRQGTGGHALLAYGAERVSDTEARLFIYDCNYPGQARTLTLTGAGGSLTAWSYDMGGYGVWGSGGADGALCSISYVPGGTLLQIWNNRGKPETKNQLLTVNAENLSIVNYDNETVAELVDGQLVTKRRDVYELPELSMYWGGERSIYLPKDYYTISTTDNITLEASLTDENLGASVTTTAGTVSFSVEDETGENTVEVRGATVTDTYTVSLESSLYGGAVKTVTASGSRAAGGAEAETISISLNAATGDLSLSKNSTLDSLSVDGVEKISYVITAFSGAGGTVTPSGDTKVPAHGEVTYTVKPAPGYVTDTVSIDGSPVAVMDSYPFSNVIRNHTISATFRKSGPVNAASYAVTALSVDTGKLSVTLSNPASCTAAAMFYGADGQFLALSYSAAAADCGTVSIPLPAGLPEKYTIKAALFGDGWCPLCAPYQP